MTPNRADRARGLDPGGERRATPVPGNQELDEAAREARIRTFFRPYHAAVAAVLDARIAAGRWPVLVSMHSFTPVMDAFERPWQIGVLWNQDGRLPIALMDRLRALGITVGDNEPYSGRDAHGYSQHVHGDERGVANVLIEVRQDLIDTHHGAEEWGDLLAGVLHEVLSDPRALQTLPGRMSGEGKDGGMDPSFTIGIEEEYLLVDRETRDLVVEAPDSLMSECERQLEGRVSPEFMQSQDRGRHQQTRRRQECRRRTQIPAQDDRGDCRATTAWRRSRLRPIPLPAGTTRSTPARTATTYWSGTCRRSCGGS